MKDHFFVLYSQRGLNVADIKLFIQQIYIEDVLFCGYCSWHLEIVANKSKSLFKSETHFSRGEKDNRKAMVYNILTGSDEYNEEERKRAG